MTEELPHIRCIECNKVLAHKWNRYQKLLSDGIKPGTALTMLGFTRSCCRIRMMNPFKVPSKSERFAGLEQPMENLTLATGKSAPIEAALNAMEQTKKYTVVPAMGGIDLPSIPKVALPEIPAPGGNIQPEQPGNIVKTYQAW